jgi:hypothetical protein
MKQKQQQQQDDYTVIDRVLALDSSLRQLPNDLALRPDPHLLMSYTPLLQHPMPMGYEVQECSIELDSYASYTTNYDGLLLCVCLCAHAAVCGGAGAQTSLSPRS